ncbi:hypothetical protein EDC04DRAFT_2609500 [Pisolithus marmoratus]|nr:hypothetical protein EDC04DRAFT_2609500 [Pisolithus marmoratus]
MVCVQHLDQAECQATLKPIPTQTKKILVLAEVGSENDELEGIAGDDQSGIKDDNDNDRGNGTQFSSHAVPTKLSGITKEHLTYSKNKVPKAPPMTPDIDRGIASSNNEDLEGPFLSLHPSSDCESSQHKKTKERCLGYTTPEVEDNPPARDMREVPPCWRYYDIRKNSLNNVALYSVSSQSNSTTIANNF